MVEYKYDAYGNCTYGYTINNDLADNNPIRYRGYYYDRETGLYYLNARYYNPEWRRFISPDDTAYLDPESVNGLNLYGYCNNDPVNYADPNGNFGFWIAALIGAGILGLAGLGATAYADLSDDGEIFNGSIGAGTYIGNTLVAASAGALGGGLIFTFGPSIASFLGSSLSSAIPAIGTLSTGGALALTGVSVIGGAIVTAGIVLLLFASDHRPGNNRVQNKQLRDAVRKTGHNPNDPRIKDKINIIEKYIRSKKLDLGWKELLEVVRRFLE